MSAVRREGSPPDSPALVPLALIPAARIDGRGLRLDALLLRAGNALRRLPEGDLLELSVDPGDAVTELRAWCTVAGATFVLAADDGHATVVLLRAGPPAFLDRPDTGARLPASDGGAVNLRRWLVGKAAEVPEKAPGYTGLIPRGAVPERGARLPAYPFTLNARDDVWADSAGELYEQATARTWNAASDIPWQSIEPLDEALEQAVCQLMTFLAENEYAAMLIPARFLPRINPQFTEVLLFLGSVISEEARHIEAFTRRALANGGGLQYSSALTAWSLHTLLVQEDYFRSSFLLHVLGEGTFLELLEFIERHAPDPATREVARRARIDEGRHVAYGLTHVRHVLSSDPVRVDELVEAAEERAATLRATSGSNPLILEALAILAGGGANPEQFGRGLDRARDLYRAMDAARVQRMLQLGLGPAAAQKISSLHSPNFM